MEYVKQHGAFDDMPLARIVADFAATYPALQGESAQMQRADFDADVAREVER
jgi:hypothetical protein